MEVRGRLAPGEGVGTRISAGEARVAGLTREVGRHAGVASMGALQSVPLPSPGAIRVLYCGWDGTPVVGGLVGGTPVVGGLVGGTPVVGGLVGCVVGGWETCDGG